MPHVYLVTTLACGISKMCKWHSYMYDALHHSYEYIYQYSGNVIVPSTSFVSHPPRLSVTKLITSEINSLIRPLS